MLSRDSPQAPTTRGLTNLGRLARHHRAQCVSEPHAMIHVVMQPPAPSRFSERASDDADEAPLDRRAGVQPRDGRIGGIGVGPQPWGPPLGWGIVAQPVTTNSD